ncbi:MAG: HAD family phosphatase [Bacteroidales bacterium]|nr:HAD family phosphatase [Bacteroidales bacterium]
MIRNLVFDLGGVLINLNRISCLRAFDEIVRYKDFAAVFGTYRQLGFFDKFENGSISARQFRNIIRINSQEVPGKEKVQDHQIDFALNCYMKDLPQDKIDTLLFYQHDYRIFLLSNTNPISMVRVREMFQERGYKMEELFEMLFLSYKMKDAKPNASIFQKMVRKAKINPEETLFIDDSLANIQAAQALGFAGLHYDPHRDLYASVAQKLKEIEASGH